jgi:hypothetical protein
LKPRAMISVSSIQTLRGAELAVHAPTMQG